MLMKLSKPYITLIASVIILGMFALFSHQAKIAYKNRIKANALEKTINNENKQAKVDKLRLNDSLEVMQASVENLQVTLSNLKSKYNNLLAASKVKVKYVDRITEIKTTTHSVDTVICKVDSFDGLTAHLDDGYANIKVDIDTARRATIDYTINDSLTVINYTKRHSLFFGLIKWKSYQGTKVITHNPKASPITVISYSMIDK